MIVHRAHREHDADARLFHTGAAHDLIGTIRRDRPTYAAQAGQVSLSQIVLELLRQTGPAHVTIATWSATEDEMAAAGRALRSAAMLSLTIITERKFAARMRDRLAYHFPGARVIPGRIHAKYTLIRNESWDLAVTSSMNLAQQPRLESALIRNSPALCNMLAPTEEGEPLAIAVEPPIPCGRITPPARMASVGPLQPSFI